MLLVVASMIGTGVYTTTGFLIRDVGSPSAVLLAWAVGGVAALCGALSYGELAAALPVSGGEYSLLSRIYHPILGFMAGWVSLLVGFAAPAAAASLAFGSYLAAVVPAVPPVPAALVLLAVASVVHAMHIGWSSGFQNGFTTMKVVLGGVFVVWGLILLNPEALARVVTAPVGPGIASPGFAVGVVYVSYAYTGWNAAAYVAGEVRDPSRTLPWALGLGTAVVILFYMATNLVMLAAVPAERLAGVLEVGHVTADVLLGRGAATLVSMLICIGLVSSTGAMMLAGPRVLEAMGHDYPRLQPLARRRPGGGPVVAVALQAGVAAVLVVSAGFDDLLTYIGVTLSLSSALTVAGVFVLRRREPQLARPYRTWGYPVTPLLFLLVVAWIVAFVLWERPYTALTAGATLAAGAGLYFVVRRPQ